MNVESVPINSINPYKLNSKKHPESQVNGIAESIKRFGFTQPVVIDGEGTIIIGHGRVEAAKKAGLLEVPCLKMNELSKSEVKALRLIDNRISETGWDADLLSLDLKEIDFNFEPFDVNFDKLLIGVTPMEGLTDADEVPEDVEAKTVLGDLYQLGNHRLICGDSTSPDNVSKLLNGVKPHLMVTDPPYGVNYDPEWRNEAAEKGTILYASKATGAVTNDDKFDWSQAISLFEGDVVYVWHAGVYAAEIAIMLEKLDFTVRSQIIWAKQGLVISRGHYHWQHEPCWYAVKKGKTGHWSGDRKQTTLWHIQNSNPRGGKKEDTRSIHSTQKPVECMRRPIENNSSIGQAVYDPFGGSGTTLIAAEQTGRHCYMLEIDPKYCDIIVKRWENFTGKKAELLNGKTI